MDKGIENAIIEQQTLLQTLEKLMTKDLIESQGAKMFAQVNIDLTKSKEAKAIESSVDDQRDFLATCKTFREKVTNLSRRGECFGLTTPVAPLGAYAILRLRALSENRYKKDNGDENGNENDADTDNDESFQLIDDSLLVTMDLIDKNEKHDNNDQEENDEDIQDILRRLREQKEENEKYQIVLQDEKNKQSSLQETKDKRESQKNDLQSQCERLRRDSYDVQSQIENLKRQTEEARDMTTQFRNDVKRGLQNQTSAYTNSSTRSNVVDTGRTITTTTSAATSATFTNRRKSTNNPYAPANRRRNIATTSLSSVPANNPSRTISPVTGPTARESTGSNNSHSLSRERDKRDNPRDRQHAAGTTITTTTTKASKKSHQQSPNRSGRIHSSRHFGVTGSPFRAPGASLLCTTTNFGIIGQNKTNREFDNNDNTYGDSSSDDSSQHVNSQKRRNSLMLQDLEDTDDDDDDDSVWLNAPPTFSSSTKRKRN